jgi:hypothetical protein
MRFAGLALLGLVLAGCGHPERAAVSRYISQVDQIEAALAMPLKAVTIASSEFGPSHGPRSGPASPRPGTTPQPVSLAQIHASLTHALRQIRALRAKLAAIEAPAPAHHLRDLLVQLVDKQAAMTLEVAKLADFLPRFAAALTPLPLATRQMQVALTVTQPRGYGRAGVVAALAVKADALRRYKVALEAVVAQLRKLDPPQVSKPQYSTQVVTLERMGTTVGQLADALGHGQTTLASLLRQFNAAAAGNQTIAAQKAQIAAVHAYNNRAVELAQLTRKIGVERVRLGNTLK